MDDDRSRRLPLAPIVVVVVVLLLPALYVLSAGPVGALVDNGYINADSALCHGLQVFYWPLIFCAEHCPPFQSFLIWYTKVCGGP